MPVSKNSSHFLRLYMRHNAVLPSVLINGVVGAVFPGDYNCLLPLSSFFKPTPPEYNTNQKEAQLSCRLPSVALNSYSPLPFSSRISQLQHQGWYHIRVVSNPAESWIWNSSFWFLVAALLKLEEPNRLWSMFDIFFGWRKASKWFCVEGLEKKVYLICCLYLLFFLWGLYVLFCSSKKLIKRVQCRLKLLKNKRYTIVKQLREDLAQLIKLGYEESAFNRVGRKLKIFLLNSTLCNLLKAYPAVSPAFCGSSSSHTKQVEF